LGWPGSGRRIYHAYLPRIFHEYFFAKFKKIHVGKGSVKFGYFALPPPKEKIQYSTRCFSLRKKLSLTINIFYSNLFASGQEAPVKFAALDFCEIFNGVNNNFNIILKNG
jgi:hypothetical protein